MGGDRITGLAPEGSVINRELYHLGVRRSIYGHRGINQSVSRSHGVGSLGPASSDPEHCVLYGANQFLALPFWQSWQTPDSS